MAGPTGSKPNSSSRRHCRRIQRLGNAHGDQRRVEGGIVGAVVAVAARAVQVLRGDRLDRQAEHRRRGSCATDACPGRASAPSGARRGTRPARTTATSRRARCRAARRSSGRGGLGGVAGAGQAPMRRSSLGWPFSHAASCCAGSRRRALSHLACAGAAAAAACATLSTGLTKATKLASRMICSSPFARHGGSRPRRATPGWRRDWAGAACGHAGRPWAGRRGRRRHRSASPAGRGAARCLPTTR